MREAPLSVSAPSNYPDVVSSSNEPAVALFDSEPSAFDATEPLDAGEKQLYLCSGLENRHASWAPPKGKRFARPLPAAETS